ncbi:MAG: hypothetical protein AAF514_08155 [Verrucomicrobiota bacterium]
MNRVPASLLFSGLTLLFCSCAAERTIVSEERIAATAEEQLREHFAGWERDDENRGMASTSQRSSFEEQLEDGKTYQKKQFAKKSFADHRYYQTREVEKKRFRDKRAREQEEVARLDRENPFTDTVDREENQSFRQQFDKKRADREEGKRWEKKSYATKSYQDDGKRSRYDGRTIAPSSMEETGGEENPFRSPEEIRQWNKRWSIGQIKRFLEGRNNEAASDTP